MAVFLGIDIGTSGTKTLAMREDGTILAIEILWRLPTRLSLSFGGVREGYMGVGPLCHSKIIM